MPADAGGPPPALSAQLIGARAALAALAPYEHGTGFHCSAAASSSRLVNDHLSAPHAPPVHHGALRAHWLECVDGLIGGLGNDGQEGEESPADGVSAQRTAVPKTPVRKGVRARVASSSGTPSTDTIDLTSDSGHSFGDHDSVSSLASPVPRSASPSPVLAQKPLAPLAHRLGPLLPRIRRLSTTSLPTTSFSSPAVSPGPIEHAGLTYPSSLSLDLEYTESAQDEEDEMSALATSVSDIHIEDAKERSESTSLSAPMNRDSNSPSARARKTNTRALVEQMRRDAEAARSTHPDASSKSPPPSDAPSTDAAPPSSPPPQTAEPIYIAAPSFARPPRGPSVLPRCSDDLKDAEQDWWALYDAAPPAHPPPGPRIAPPRADAHGWMYAPPPDEAFNRAFRFPGAPAPYQPLHALVNPPAPPPAPALTPDDFPALPSPRSQPAVAATSTGGAQAAGARKRAKKAKKGSSAGGSVDSKDGLDDERKPTPCTSPPSSSTKKPRPPSVSLPAPGKPGAPVPSSRAYVPQYPTLFSPPPAPGYAPALGYAYPTPYAPPFAAYAHAPAYAPQPVAAAFAGYVQVQAQLQHARATAAVAAAALAVPVPVSTAYGMYVPQPQPPQPTAGVGQQGYYR